MFDYVKENKVTFLRVLFFDAPKLSAELKFRRKKCLAYCKIVSSCRTCSVWIFLYNLQPSYATNMLMTFIAANLWWVVENWPRRSASIFRKSLQIITQSLLCSLHPYWILLSHTLYTNSVTCWIAIIFLVPFFIGYSYNFLLLVPVTNCWAKQLIEFQDTL